jgi:hypothetical protein
VTHTAVIKFAPAFTAERFLDPASARPGRTMYQRLQFLPSKNAIPLLVNHEDDREIGTVHELFRMDWIDGPWICARATVNADAPSWLKSGARASFGFKALDTRDTHIREHRAEVVAHAIVNEDKRALA